VKATDRQGTLGGAAAALLAAGIGLGTAFGLHITQSQQAAILTFCAAVAVAAPLVGALFDHSTAQVAGQQSAAKEIANGKTGKAASQAANLQAEIDKLSAQKEALGGD
jgi:hypothetical protein